MGKRRCSSDGHTLAICEVFKSIQGEGRFQGYSQTFVRLAGCNLRCSFCDSAYSWNPGKQTLTEELVKSIPSNSMVDVTGGEPLLQNLAPLIRGLFNKDCTVLVETNGTITMNLPKPVWIACSPKPPHINKAAIRSFNAREHSFFKFVIDDLSSYKRAMRIITSSHIKHDKVYLMPEGVFAAGQIMKAREIGKWLASDGIDDICIQPRLHILLYGNRRGT